MIDYLTGPQDVFNSASGLITRKVKTLRILSETGATFTVLDPMYPSGDAGAVANAAGITISSNIDIHHIKRFQVATGAVLAIFYGAPSPAL